MPSSPGAVSLRWPPHDGPSAPASRTSTYATTSDIAAVRGWVSVRRRGSAGAPGARASWPASEPTPCANGAVCRGAALSAPKGSCTAGNSPALQGGPRGPRTQPRIVAKERRRCVGARRGSAFRERVAGARLGGGLGRARRNAADPMPRDETHACVDADLDPPRTLLATGPRNSPPDRDERSRGVAPLPNVRRLVGLREAVSHLRRPGCGLECVSLFDDDQRALRMQLREQLPHA